MPRVLAFVMDSAGVGALPDASSYGDAPAANTIANVAERLGGLRLPNFEQLGLGRITAIRGVTAVDQNGMTLTSDSLSYDDPTEVIHGQGNVVLHSPQGEELRGDSLDWNLRDGHINVSGAR